jgi:threonyl-tRNA synthetase
MNYKIRESQTKKVPYTLVLGDNEAQNNLITYRHHGTNNSVTLTIDEFINQVVKEVETKGKE